MTGKKAGREEVLDALEEAAADSLKLYRSLVDSETFEGAIDDPDAKALVEDWNADLKRWYSMLRRSGRDIGDIPELGMVEP